MRIQPITLDSDALWRYSELLKACFPVSKQNHLKFSESTLKWLYIENPDGPAIGFDAFDGDTLVAHYVCIPTVILHKGRHLRGLLSLNTATLNRAQGKGLFSKLATLTFNSAKLLGYQYVYGIANHNSTHGFVNRLGFTLISPLEASIGFGHEIPETPKPFEELSFRRVWTPQTIEWRCANPANPIYHQKVDDCTRFYSKTQIPGLSVHANLPLAPPPTCRALQASNLRLFIGLSNSYRQYLRWNIPQKLRPSPLNFIFKSLTDQQVQPHHSTSTLNFLDFDVY